MSSPWQKVDVAPLLRSGGEQQQYWRLTSVLLSRCRDLGDATMLEVYIKHGPRAGGAGSGGAGA